MGSFTAKQPSRAAAQPKRCGGDAVGAIHIDCFACRGGFYRFNELKSPLRRAFSWVEGLAEQGSELTIDLISSCDEVWSQSKFFFHQKFLADAGVNLCSRWRSLFFKWDKK